MTELTDERLAELRRITEGAESQEPWRTDDDEGRMVFAASGFQVYYALFGSNNGDAEPGDAAHIAAFDPPTAIALLDEVDELRRRLDAVEARHTPVTVRYGDAPDELACRACGTHYEYPVAWPCPTVKAARGEA